MGKTSTESTAAAFKSSLKTGAERFLAQSLAHALEKGFRTPDDFLRHFKPLDLMVALESAIDLRADILVKAAGVHQKIALKKSTSSGAEDLRIAIEEGLTDAAAILELFPADERVRYLDSARLWSFLVEDEFWSTLNAEANRERAIGRMTFTLENALHEDLLSLADITDGITFEMLATRLPHKELQKLVSHALKLGRERKPLTEEALLDAVSLPQIVGYVPLEHVWKAVIVERVAKPAGFLGASPSVDAKVGPPANRSSSQPIPPALPKDEASAEARKSAPPPQAPSVPAARAKQDSLVEIAAAEDDVDKLMQNSQRPAPEEEARRRVLEKLAGISRLPPHHEALTTPVLLSIESMYAELLSASTDEAREMCIRESFPNPTQMSAALLALIELLDPSIDINDPVIRDADVDSLIKVVLFEERHRYEQAHPSLRPPPSPSPLPPPLASRRGSVAPPPLPRAPGAASLPPPLPPPGGEKRAR